MNLPNSTKIMEVQNEDENIIIQSAAGHYFNLAECLNYACWVLCILSAIISFKSNEVSFAVVMIVMDTLAALCGFMMIKYMENAADLRRLFDLRVVIGDDKEINSNKQRYLKELSICYFERHKKSCQRDMQNGGDDKPRGKRNWYIFMTAVNSPKAQMECLNQNRWWEKKITVYRYVMIVLLQIIIITVAIFLYSYLGGLPVAAIINACAILLFRYGERLRQGVKRYAATIRTATALDIVGEHPTVCGIKKCIEYIDEYRRIPVFGINIIHRIWAGKLTRIYRKTSSN